jgi:predicted aspartyl protease
MLAWLLLALVQSSTPAQSAQPKRELKIEQEINREVIAHYDTDKDGGLSPAEHKVLAAAQLEAAIAANPEAQKSLTAEKRSEFLNKVIASFPLLDTNRDGKITPADFKVRGRFRLEPRERFKPVPYQSVNGWIVFRAVVAGQEVWGLLDNGAGHSLVDAGLARTAGIKTALSAKLPTPTGVIEAAVAPRVSVSLPGNMQAEAPIHVADLSFVSAGAGRQIGLVIGREYFSNFAVIVDRQKATFAFVPSGAFRTGPNDLPIALIGNGQQLEAVINGKRLLLALDLGSTGQVALSRSAWDAAVPKDAKIRPGSAMFADGKPVKTQTVTIASLTVGGRTVRNVGVSLSPILKSEVDGRLGIGLLTTSSFALDAKAGKLWIQPSAPGPIVE